MAKKKTSVKKSSFMEAVGVKNIFQNEKINFLIGILLFGVAVYMILSFVSFFSTGSADQTLILSPRDGEISNQNGEFQNSCGSLGAYTAYFFIKQCFGLPSFLMGVGMGTVFAFLVLLSLRLMKAYTSLNLLKWLMVLGIVMVWLSVTFAKFLSPFFVDSSYCPGGDHGLFICQQIEGYLGAPGLTAVLALVAIAFLTYISAETIYFFRKLFNPSKIFNKVKFTINDPTKKDNEPNPLTSIVEDPDVFDDPYTQTVEWKNPTTTHATDMGKPELKETPTQNDAKDPQLVVEAADEGDKATDKKLRGDLSTPYDPKLELENYHYPTLDLLKKYEDDGKPYIDMAEQNANKNRIVEVLRNFGIEIDAIKATVGPTITLYEITPAQGVRISKIRNLEDDIALSLKAMGIRIIAPIPGKGTIGIEVPNAKASIVSMESVLNSKKFQETTMDLPCAMGKTITNEVFMFDLAKMPHLLVAGATGQGKSVGLNAILTSLLYKKHPAELKIVLVDPKMVEFSIYSKIDKHFLAKVPDDSASPIITDTSKVVRTLNSLCVEMDDRYELLMAAGERNIKDYNKKFIARKLNPENGHRFMPYIVVVIDEYGDLIMTAGKEIELPIARIAQKARAVGIHMIIATQRPTTNIITGTIKANFPARIAFKVAQGIDSKTILDRMGANQLIGRGDMLFLQGNEPIRVQCAFVDTPEVDAINEFIASQQGYVSTFELPEPKIEGDGDLGGGSNDVDMNHLDPLFEEAAHLIVMSQSGSTSLIQRKFAIGYNRAGRLMDQLEKAGVVGAAMGSKPRDVLIQDEMSLENLISQLK